jgi:hypothetical protein
MQSGRNLICALLLWFLLVKKNSGSMFGVKHS